MTFSSTISQLSLLSAVSMLFLLQIPNIKFKKVRLKVWNCVLWAVHMCWTAVCTRKRSKITRRFARRKVIFKHHINAPGGRLCGSETLQTPRGVYIGGASKRKIPVPIDSSRWAGSSDGATDNKFPSVLNVGSEKGARRRRTILVKRVLFGLETKIKKSASTKF